MFCEKLRCFLKTRHLKKHLFLKGLIQQSMQIIHNRIVLCIAYTILMRKRLVLLVSKSHDLSFFPFFLKKHDLNKMHLFNQSNRKSMHILHNSIFYALYMLLLKGTA